MLYQLYLQTFNFYDNLVMKRLAEQNSVYTYIKHIFNIVDLNISLLKSVNVNKNKVQLRFLKTSSVCVLFFKKFAFVHFS